MPWPEFKKLIFEIIDHRIEFSAEISGAINTTYLTMDEHLVLYWVGSFLLTPINKPKVEQFGTHKDVQGKLIEFLFSLKYYSSRWLRAKIYCQLCGFITEQPQDMAVPLNYFKPDQTLLEAGINNLDFSDVEIPINDIYSQEFFFYAYSFITKDRIGFKESKEGYTYIKQQYEAR